MPLVDWSDGTAWHAYYQGSDGTTGYGQRLNRDAIFGRRFRALTANFPIQPADRILVVGCAFGYLIERFHDNGYPNCWGIDSSADIAARRGTEARGSVLWVKDTMSGVGRVKNALRALTGDDVFDWVITEELLESYTDAEITTLLNVCEGALTPGTPQSHIIHIVAAAASYPVPSWQWFPGNWKTLADWNAMRPAHSWTGPTDGWLVL